MPPAKPITSDLGRHCISFSNIFPFCRNYTDFHHKLFISKYHSPKEEAGFLRKTTGLGQRSGKHEMRLEHLLTSERTEVPKTRFRSTRARRRGWKPTSKSSGGRSGNNRSSKENHTAYSSGPENKIDARELRHKFMWE